MSMFSGRARFSGELLVRPIRARKAGWRYKLKNLARLWPGLWRRWLAQAGGVAHFRGELFIRARIKGEWVNYGLVSTRLVTNVWVNDVVDNLIAETSAFGDYKYHQSGTGTTAPAITDTDIESKCGSIAKVAGTQVENAVNIYETVATITYDSSYTVTEHALTNNPADATGVLMDRHTFTGLPMGSGDQIQFTHRLTCSSGG